MKVVLVLGLVGVISWAWIVWGIVRYAERDDTQPAAAAIVLGAAVRNGRPTPIFRERINHAVNLYQSGTVDYLIFTGGIGRGDVMSEAAVARQYAMERGVAAADILVEERSTNTIENIAYANQVARAAGIDSFLIVSTPYHMKRALWIADDLEMIAYSSPTRTTRWRSDRTRRAALVQESISYIVHIFRRWNADPLQTG